MIRIGKFFTETAFPFFRSTKFLIGLGVFLLLCSIGGGVYAYLNHSTKTQVTQAVKGANDTASVETMKAQHAADTKANEIDVKTRVLREQTIKDYANARNQVSNAPAQERAAPVPPLIIDTLNELDRLRSARDPDAVPSPNVPVG